MFDNVYHLFARHQALAEDQGFLEWLKRHGASTWFETGFDDPQPRVVVISNDETSAWAALEEVELNDDFPRPSLLRTAIVDLTLLPSRDEAVRAGLTAMGAGRADLIGARLSVHFDGADEVEAEWAVEAVVGGGVRKFGTRSGLHKKNRSLEAIARTRLLRPMVADDMATNELHSPYLFQAEAQQWTAGPLAIREKARRIAVKVSQTYRYDGSINLISEFTWADYLTRDRNGRRGICDEYAVVQISYLRSIGIPSRLKFMIWQDAAGQGVGHACLEFSDGGRWTHMDGLWNAFDQPSIYRTNGGARNLTVMDADYPSDARSTAPAWGKPDPTGDGLLYPYGDFLLNPGYPGNARPGYSS